MIAAARMLLLSVSVLSIGLATLRVAARLTRAPDLRIVVGGSLAVAAIVLETLVLGLFGIGGDSIALGAAAIVTYVAIRLSVTAADGPPLHRQLRSGLVGLSMPWQAGAGGALGAGMTGVVYLLWRPYFGRDALVYHLGQPVLWLADGHPGSLHAVEQGVPEEAFPKNAEVLFSWLLGISRSLAPTTVVMFFFLLIAAVAMGSALIRLGVPRIVTVLAAAAVLLTPLVTIQLTGANTDLPTLSWILATAALCVGARDEPKLTPVAIVTAGLAIGTKLTAAPMVVILLVVTLAAGRRELQHRLAVLAVSAAAGLALSLTWFVQTWAAFGGPLYPYYRFPSAPPTPYVVQRYGVSFLHDPGGALQAAGWNGYFQWLGGSVVLLATLVPVIAVALVMAGRRAGRDALFLAAAAVGILELLLWTMAPFTGWPGLPNTAYFVGNGTRYLLPGLPAIGLPFVLLARPGKRQATVVGLVLAVAVAADLWSQRQWSEPYRPPAVGLAAGAAIGALAALLVAQRRSQPVSRSRWTIASPVAVAGASAAVLASAAALAVVENGYIGRAVAIKQPQATAPLGIANVVRWINRQGQWLGGHQPVAVGPQLNTLLAGSQFDHDLVLITQATSCRTVQADAAHDWVIMTLPLPGAPVGQRFDRTLCLTGRQAYFGGGWVVYRPGQSRPPAALPDDAAARPKGG